MFNDDFIEYVELLNKHGVEYILVGGVAVNLHGYRRATGDMDIWVKPTPANHKRLIKVHLGYRMPMGEMAELDNFLNTEKYDVFQFGGGLYRIDVLTACKGLDFDEAYRSASERTFGDLRVRLVDIDDLIEAKRYAGRFKDLEDIKQLHKLKGKKK